MKSLSALALAFLSVGCGGELPLTSEGALPPQTAQERGQPLQLGQSSETRGRADVTLVSVSQKLRWSAGVRDDGYWIELAGRAEELACPVECDLTCRERCEVVEANLSIDDPAGGLRGSTIRPAGPYVDGAEFVEGWAHTGLFLLDEEGAALWDRAPTEGSQGIVELTLRGSDGRLFSSERLPFVLIDPLVQ